jgi:hypothetical protein
MNRRHFLILGLLTLVALVTLAVPPMKDPGFQGSLNKPVGGTVDGPNAYTYYPKVGTNNLPVEDNDSTFVSIPITCTNAGTVTKIGWYMKSSGAIQTLRSTVWRWNGSRWVFHECIDVNTAASTTPTWYDSTLASPFTVTNNEVFRLAGVRVNDYAISLYIDSSGLDTASSETRAIANACITNEPAFTAKNDYPYQGRAYVD